MFKVGEAEDETLEKQIDEELRAVTKNLLGWPATFSQFDVALQEIRRSKIQDQAAIDNITKLLTSLLARATDYRNMLGEHATILATYQNVRTTKRMVGLNKWLAGSTALLAVATLVLALSSLSQVHF